MRIKSEAALRQMTINKSHKEKIKNAFKAVKSDSSNLPPALLLDNGDPHKILFNRLNMLYPNIAEIEKTGLVPNRRFRADIYLPESGLVVEVDGFQFHRSKEKFQSDRDRRNLMTLYGYPVLAYYYARIKNDVDGVVSEIIATHQRYKALRHN